MSRPAAVAQGRVSRPAAVAQDRVLRPATVAQDRVSRPAAVAHDLCLAHPQSLVALSHKVAWSQRPSGNSARASLGRRGLPAPPTGALSTPEQKRRRLRPW